MTWHGTFEEKRYVQTVNPFCHSKGSILYWHYEGLAPSQIASLTGHSQEEVRKKIVKYWRYGR